MTSNITKETSWSPFRSEMYMTVENHFEINRDLDDVGIVNFTFDSTK